MVSIREQLLDALSQAGAEGATTTQVESLVRYERHTVAKYLAAMEASGEVYHKKVGKAKLWYINRAPLKTALHALTAKRTYMEGILAGIIQDLPYGLMVIDRGYTILFQNQRVTEWYGDVEGETFYSIVLGLDHPIQLRKITKVLEGEKPLADITMVDSSDRSLKIRASRLITPDKSPAVILILHDDTRRVEAERDLALKTALLEAERAALDKAVEVTETDPDGVITYVNDRFVKLSGYTRSELLGKTHSVVSSGRHDKRFFSRMWQRINKGEVWRGRICNKAKSGREYWCDAVIVPITLGGRIVKHIAVRWKVER